MSGEKKRYRRPYIALFLSFLMPGLGQFYNSQVQKGLVIITIFMIINYLASEPLKVIMDVGVENVDMIDRNTLILFGAYSIAALFLTIVAMLDAKLTAEKLNEEIE
ncbi:MAG: hypothetical protein GTO02_05595 [Candidatus Dadabacteria bacterium]|nr:hypothetical protein [Candidatus Dadabacteria bacterium]NIQ13880.1 hypothetical protein [Candidatus Dadabacteria bacterium]